MSLPVDHVDAPNDGQGAANLALPFWTTFSLLYLFGAGLLAWRLGSRPESDYNWESYTLRGLIDFVHQPTWDVLRLNEGLMTDSGRSAVVVGPAWVGVK